MVVLLIPSISWGQESPENEVSAEIKKLEQERADFEKEYFQIPKLQIPEVLPWPDKLSAPTGLQDGSILLPKDLADALAARLYDCEMLPLRFVQFTLWRDQLWMGAVKRAIKVREEEVRAEVVTKMRPLLDKEEGWPTWQVGLIVFGATVTAVIIGGAVGYGIGVIGGM